MKQNVGQYIQRLLAIAVLATGVYFAINFLEFYFVIPFALLVYSFLHWRITEIKPPYLFGLKSLDQFITKKDSFWGLFRIILTFLGIAYDIVLLVLWGIYLLFELFIDLLSLIKEILFWMVHAMIWFLKLFVPPIVFMYRMFIHYIIKWTWWSYQLAYRKAGPSIKFSYFIIGLVGAVITLFVLFFFYYLDVLFNTSVFVYIGIVLSSLPIAWAFGEIAAVNDKNLEEEPFYEITSNFENGMAAVKNIFYYVLAFLLLFGIQFLLDLAGWIPDAGLALGSIVLNINTLISILLIFIFIILVFANAIIPTHIIKSEPQETPMHEVLHLFKTILGKGLRYITTFIPSLFFGIIVSLIPALLVGLAIALTFTIKDNMLQSRVDDLTLKRTESELTEMELYKLDKKINKLTYYKEFPEVVLYKIIEGKAESFSINGYKEEMQQIEHAIENKINEVASLKIKFDDQLKNLNNQLRASSNQEIQKNTINAEINKLKSDYNRDLLQADLSIKKLQVDRQYLKNIKKQMPIKLFFVVIWISLFGGLVVAFFIAYMGNVFYTLYDFREDGTSTYFKNQVDEISEKDSKQPLLGFTLLVVVLIILMLIVRMGIPS